MKEMYSLKFLISKFLKDIPVVTKDKKEFLEMFRENNPDTPIPDHLKDDFNLPLAFLSICNEISLIKERLDDKNHH